jgi:hypothetical protein
MTAVSLCMIVKNEAAIIKACLDSARPLIDHVLIVDTGSTDGTQQAIREWLAATGLPGDVVDVPWRDFAFNRSDALARLREVSSIDYALIIDADDRLVYEPGFDSAAFKASLTLDAYDVAIELTPIHYSRTQICSNRKSFCYRGVLHEFLDVPTGFTRAAAQGFKMLCTREGHRSKSADKYRDDAETLKRALVVETDPFLRARYTFYLAQSLRDGGEPARAIKAYLERAKLGFWREEAFESLYAAGQLMERLNYPSETIIGTYLRAYEASPTRAESLYALTAYAHRHQMATTGYMIGKTGLTIARPSDGLFVQDWVYEYGMLDEFAVAAYWAGRYQESFDAASRLLSEGRLPEPQRARVEKNVEFAKEALGR